MWAFVTFQLINETVGLQKTPNIMIKKEKRKKKEKCVLEKTDWKVLKEIYENKAHTE